MGYYELDHVAHVRSNYGKEPSELGKRVATIVGCVFGGLYNTVGAEKVDWANPRWMELKTYAGGEMATWDFDAMTRLVFFAHDLCVRVSFQPHSKSEYKILFHLRDRDAEGMSARHPTIEDAIARHRAAWPVAKCIQKTAQPETEAA